MHDILRLILEKWSGPIMVVVLIAASLSYKIYIPLVKRRSTDMTLKKSPTLVKLFVVSTWLSILFSFGAGSFAALTMLDYFPNSSVIVICFLVAWASFFISFQYAACRLVASMPNSVRRMRTHWMLISIFTPAFPLLAFAACKMAEKSSFSFADYISSPDTVTHFAISCICSIPWLLYSQKPDRLENIYEYS